MQDHKQIGDAAKSSAHLGRVLVVDDDSEFAFAVKRQLTAAGWNVSVVLNGAEALETLSREHFDALLLDLGMTPVDGWAVLAHSRQLSEPPATVLLSGHLDVPTTVKALNAGAVDALTKPANPRRLVSTLHRALGLTSPTEFGEADEHERPPDAADDLLGESSAVRKLRARIRSVGRHLHALNSCVLITGEPGTGKRLIAKILHHFSGATGNMVRVDCGTVTVEDLFGRSPDEPGLLAKAKNGTLVLCNILLLAPALQLQLLQVLEAGRFRPTGSESDQAIDANVISTSDRIPDLEHEVTIRPDLFYRLAGFTLGVPPLRERTEDIAVLSGHFLSASALATGTRARLSPRALQSLRQQPWYNNVSELVEVLDAALENADDATLSAADIERGLRRSAGRPSAPGGELLAEPQEAGLRDVERNLILETFESTGRNISETARRLALPRSTLRDKLRRYGVR